MLSSESRGAKHPVLGGAGPPEEDFPCHTPLPSASHTMFAKGSGPNLPCASGAPLLGKPFPSFFIWLAPICSLHLLHIPFADCVLTGRLGPICRGGTRIPKGKAFGALRGRSCDSPAGPSPRELLEGRVQAHRRPLGIEQVTQVLAFQVLSWSSIQKSESTCFFPQELSKLGLNSDVEVELRILQLPVDYREVKQRVTRIWEGLQPQVNDGWGGSEAGG